MVDVVGNGFQMSRVFNFDDGIIENEEFHVSQSGKGLGLKMFATQVRAAQDQGFKRIEVFAAGKNGTDMNGYYTWPRFGYVGTVNWSTVDKEMPEQFRKMQNETTGHTRISAFMKTQEGREAWRKYGGSQDLHFNLKKGSYSLQVLNAYITEKSKATKDIHES